MDIHKELQPLTRYLPLEALVQKVQIPTMYLAEEVNHILPSIVLSKDGLTLASLFLITSRLLCEVKVPGPQSASEFDIISKQTIGDYRFKLWTQEIKEGDVVKASYDIAEIVLLHHPPIGYRTLLTYAGEDREGWLNQVTTALPTNIVLRHKNAS